MTLTLYTYRCPYCDSGDMGEAVGRCLNCARAARIKTGGPMPGPRIPDTAD
ncbi:hypothetical protein [Streptomyces albogriseolus]|uniref:hypothetical protein n=1 Tax=Streptomyces albogriseolus TaxID=1887 RepID=UPI003460B560